MSTRSAPSIHACPSPRNDEPSASADLVAVRLPLPPGPSIDAATLAGADGILVDHGGRTLVGTGATVRIPLPGGLGDPGGIEAATARLAAIPHGGTDGPGHPVVAFGALPFDRDEPAQLLVPSLLFRREPDGSEWVTVIGPAGDVPDPTDRSAGRMWRDTLLARAASLPRTAPVPSLLRVVPRSSEDDFRRAVTAAVAAIADGEVRKVVLARGLDAQLAGPVDVPDLLTRWRRLEPSCTLFSMPTPAGQFVGASPELLVERTGEKFTSLPLAGTTDRDHDADRGLPRSLLRSGKDGEEHRLVVQAIREALAPVSATLTVPDHPELIHLHSITHLGTAIAGTALAAADGSFPTALELAALLHPTPAVGGVPRRNALDLIERLEHSPRGTYAGPVGYVDAGGDGRWALGIRALTADGPRVHLSAGVGIVSGSRPDTELTETELKFSAVFEALTPGRPFDTSGVTA